MVTLLLNNQEKGFMPFSFVLTMHITCVKYEHTLQMRISLVAEQVTLNHFASVRIRHTQPISQYQSLGVSMKKFLTAALIAVMAVATTAYGNQTTSQVDVSQLTPAQVAEIQAKVAEMNPSTAVKISSELRQETSKWAEMGAGVATAMVAASKELGMAANDFVSTPLGKGVAIIIAYKVVGRDVLGVLIGVPVLVFSYGLAMWVVTTRRWYDGTEYVQKPVLWGLYQKSYVSKINMDSNTFGSTWFIATVTILLGTACGLNLIF